MNDQAPSNDQPILDADTTPTNPANSEPAAAGEWQMPNPVFRKTSGYLPQGFEKQFGLEGEEPIPAVESKGAAISANVEPQPDLSELLISEAPPLALQAEAKPKSGAARIVMIVIGLLGMIIFIGIFLTVIYFLFLAEPRSGQF